MEMAAQPEAHLLSHREGPVGRPERKGYREQAPRAVRSSRQPVAARHPRTPGSISNRPFYEGIMIDREEPKLSLVRQCALLGISRSSLYYLPTEAGAEDMELGPLETPFYPEG